MFMRLSTMWVCALCNCSILQITRANTGLEHDAQWIRMIELAEDLERVWSVCAPPTTPYPNGARPPIPVRLVGRGVNDLHDGFV